MENNEYESLNDNENFELNDLNEIKPNISKIKNETGTVFSSIITLANTLLGSGMLAMPSAFASSGLYLGILNVAVFGGGALFGLWLLTRCATYTGRNSSFFSLSMITFPHASIFFDLAISIKCFGVSVSYLIIVGDLMPYVTLGLFPETSLDSVYLTRELWITIAMICIIPLAFMRKLDSMRHTSFISLLAIVYLLLIVVYFYFIPYRTNEINVNDIQTRQLNNDDLSEFNSSYPDHPKIEKFIFSMNFFKNLPIFVFAFTCHQNILSVYNEMKDNRQKNVNKVISISIGFGMILYWVIGICGYLTFGEETDSNIISMYPSSSIIILIGQISMVIMVSLSYPLQMFPCRLSLDKVFYNFKRIINRNNEGASLINPTAASFMNNNNISSQVQPISDKKFFFMTLSILICSYILACSVKTLGIVLSIVGATGSTMICYILPGLLYYKLETENNRMTHRKNNKIVYAALFMFIIGIILMVVCLLSIIIYE